MTESSRGAGFLFGGRGSEKPSPRVSIPDHSPRPTPADPAHGQRPWVEALGQGWPEAPALLCESVATSFLVGL